MSDSTNLNLMPPEETTAALVLADGTVFWGRGIGAVGDAVGAALESRGGGEGRAEGGGDVGDIPSSTITTAGAVTSVMLKSAAKPGGRFAARRKSGST